MSFEVDVGIDGVYTTASIAGLKNDRELRLHREEPLDFLEILQKAADQGGPERKDAMMQTIIKARQLGCDATPGGGKIGGVNIRYGSLKYAVMDINTRGEVFVHIKHHPNKDIDPVDQEAANQWLTDLKGLEIKNAPVNHYGQCEAPIEEIDREAIDKFLEFAVGRIRKQYYAPHLDG